MNHRSRDAGQELASIIRNHAPVITVAVVILAAVLIGSIGFAMTRPSRPDTVASLATPTADATPSIQPSASPLIVTVSSPIEPSSEPSTAVTATPVATGSDEEPGPTSEPSSTPTPTPRPAPSVRIWLGGGGAYRIATGTTVDVVLHLTTQSLRRSQCSIRQTYEPDDPSAQAWQKDLVPEAQQTVALVDGRHTFVASCPSSAGTLTSRAQTIAMDRQPELCKGFDFDPGEITVTSFADLRDGVVGTWEGCVTTPWTPMYWISATFRDDGTYSASSSEILDGDNMIAMYYGTDADSSLKKYAINDLQASNLGLGQIDVVFDQNNVVRDELRNIRLMGSNLEFELFHLTQYGPITFQLRRTTTGP